MAISSTPWMGKVTLATANTVYRLSDLLAALADARKPLVSSPARCEYLSIQADPDGQATKYYIGTHDTMSATDYGIYLIATQAWQIQSMGANLIRLDQIYLMSDARDAVMYIAFLTR